MRKMEIQLSSNVPYHIKNYKGARGQVLWYKPDLSDGTHFKEYRGKVRFIARAGKGANKK